MEDRVPNLTPPSETRAGYAVLHVLIAICVAVELSLLGLEYLGIGPPRIRWLAYEYGGFWVGLLRDWRPNYPGQPVAMFVTYGFLHGGLLHLVFNMAALWSLGRAVVDRVGIRGFTALYVGALLGGGLGFALLAALLAPMVGASGALFGLAGGLLAWAYVDRYTVEEPLWPIARTVLILALLNVVIWWALDGRLAWETHLGGFVAGWIIALLIDPRPQTDG